MSLQDKYFDPNIYARKVFLLIILFIIDIIANCFTQYMDFGSENTKARYKLEKYTPSSDEMTFGVFR